MDTEGPPIEREFRRRLRAVGPISRAELLRVLTMSRKKRAIRIGVCNSCPRYRRARSSSWTSKTIPLRGLSSLAELRIMEREDG